MHGIRKLACGPVCLAASDGREPEGWAREHGLSRYFGSSFKGEAGIDWDDPEAREAFLEGVVADADRSLAVVRQTMENLPANDPLRQRLHESASLLARLLMQDIERREDGTRLKQGVSPDRVVSVHDPEMRHGRKSERRRFDGHKAHLAVDPESQLITAADVLAGNAPDHERALQLVEQSETNADTVVEEVVGDCAYGDGGTRRTFVEAGRKLVAKMAGRRGGTQFPKEDFRLDLEMMTCVCPAGQQTRKVVSISSGKRYGAPGIPLRAFRFDAAICDACSVAVFVREGALRERPFSHDPPAGGSAPGGEGVSEKRGVRAVPQTTAGCRAQAGAADATRRAPGTLLRAYEDTISTPDGLHRRQSHAGGDQGSPHARP